MKIALGITCLLLAAVCAAHFANLLGPGPGSALLQFAALSAFGFWAGIGGFTLWDEWSERRRRDEEERRLRRITIWPRIG